MLLKNRNTNLTFILLLVSIFLFSTCDNVQPKNDFNKQEEQPNDSILKQYYSNGNISSYITYEDTIRHGITKYYYANGNLKYEVMFQNGKETGTAKYYYQTGRIYMETPYREGIIYGIRKKYYKNGVLMAEIPYIEGYQTYGLREYNQSGEQIMNYPAIIIETRDNTAFNDSYTINLRLSREQNDMQFYIDKFLFLETLDNTFNGDDINIRKRDHQLLEEDFIPVVTENGEASITVSLAKGKYIMKEVLFVCSFVTSRGNVYWTFEKYNLSIENRY